MALNISTGLLPLLVLIFSGRVTSSDHLTVWGLVFPGWGIIMLFVCQACLAIQSLIHRR